MTAPPPGWYPSPDAAGMHRWWDGGQWTGHVRPTVVDVPAPSPQRGSEAAGAMPSGYAAAYEATAALQQRGGIAAAIGGLGQQYLATVLPTPAQPAPTFVPQQHAAADAQPWASAATPQSYGGARTPQYGPAGTQSDGPAGVQPYGAGTSPNGGWAPAPGSGGPVFGGVGAAQVQGAAEVLAGAVGDRRGGGVGNGFRMILMGVLFALTSFFVVPQMMSSRAGVGETATDGAVVHLHESTSDEGARMCSPEAAFTVDGVSYRARAGYSSSTCPSMGSSINVIYATADPSDARVPTSAGMLMLLGIFPVIGVALVVVGIRALVVGSSSIWSGLRRLRS